MDRIGENMGVIQGRDRNAKKERNENSTTEKYNI